MQNPESIRSNLNENDAPSPLARNLTLGEILRRARVAKGLALSDVARVLRIRQRQLQAMEEDDFGQLPSAVHAKGLLRVYARHLDLDPERIVELLDVERYWVQPVGIAPTARPIRSAPSPIQRVLVAMLTIVLVGGAGYFLARQYAVFLATATRPLIPASDPAFAARPTPDQSGDSLPASTPQSDEPSATPVPPSPTPLASPTAITAAATSTPRPAAPGGQPNARTTPTVAPVAATASPTPASAVEIEAQITGRVWLQVEVDGTVAFSGVLQPGDRRVWTGKQEIKFWAGRPQFVNVIRNGRPEGPLGAPNDAGKVWRWTPS